MTDLADRIDRLFERATEILEMTASKADEDELGPVLSLLDDLEDIADEAEDILSTADLSTIASSIDWTNLPDAVELSDLPEALSNGDASDAVALRKLVELTDLPKLWANTDVRELWREKREFDEELDDLTGDDSTAESGFGLDKPTAEMGPNDIDPEPMEAAIQSKVSDAVDEFREKLLVAHERLGAARQRAQSRFPDRRRRNSRNPTAVSTMSTVPSLSAGSPRHSTVPAETRHSSAPNRRRIYGPRFETMWEVDDG